MDNGEARIEREESGAARFENERRQKADGYLSNRRLLEEDMFHLKGGLAALADLLASAGVRGPEPKPDDMYCLVRCLMTKADLVEGDYNLLLGD